MVAKSTPISYHSECLVQTGTTVHTFQSYYLYGSFFCRFSPYERGYTYNSDKGKTDEKGSRLAKPDPIYETLFSGANGRPARTGI